MKDEMNAFENKELQKLEKKAIVWAVFVIALIWAALVLLMIYL
jgi:hypothetical protein